MPEAPRVPVPRLLLTETLTVTVTVTDWCVSASGACSEHEQ